MGNPLEMAGSGGEFDSILKSLTGLTEDELLNFCENPHETMVLIGVKDLVIVRSGSVTLVTHKDRAEDLKRIVEDMGKE